MTIGELQERFVRALAQRCTDIADLIDDGNDLERLMRGFHSLAGIAGTYGYDEVTEVSRECELCCASAIEQARALNAADRARLIAGIEAIRRYAVRSN